MAGLSRPELPLIELSDVAVQLSQSSHSSTVQLLSQNHLIDDYSR
jgi:hypothetical protein